MLVFDTVLYMLIAIYLETAFPRNSGYCQPWYYPIMVSVTGVCVCVCMTIGPSTERYTGKVRVSIFTVHSRRRYRVIRMYRR